MTRESWLLVHRHGRGRRHVHLGERVAFDVAHVLASTVVVLGVLALVRLFA